MRIRPDRGLYQLSIVVARQAQVSKAVPAKSASRCFDRVQVQVLLQFLTRERQKLACDESLTRKNSLSSQTLPVRSEMGLACIRRYRA